MQRIYEKHIKRLTPDQISSVCDAPDRREGRHRKILSDQFGVFVVVDGCSCVFLIINGGHKETESAAVLQCFGKIVDTFCFFSHFVKNII